MQDLIEHLCSTDDGLKQNIDIIRVQEKASQDRLGQRREQLKREALEEQWDIEEEEENRQVAEYQKRLMPEIWEEQEEVKAPSPLKVNVPALQLPTEEPAYFTFEDPEEEEFEKMWEKGEEIVEKAKGLMQGLKSKIAFTMN